ANPPGRYLFVAILPRRPLQPWRWHGVRQHARAPAPPEPAGSWARGTTAGHAREPIAAACRLAVLASPRLPSGSRAVALSTPRALGPAPIKVMLQPVGGTLLWRGHRTPCHTAVVIAQEDRCRTTSSTCSREPSTSWSCKPSPPWVRSTATASPAALSR